MLHTVHNLIVYYIYNSFNQVTQSSTPLRIKTKTNKKQTKNQDSSPHDRKCSNLREISNKCVGLFSKHVYSEVNPTESNGTDSPESLLWIINFGQIKGPWLGMSFLMPFLNKETNQQD